MNCVKYVLFSKFAVHCNLIFLVAHFIELFVSELALAIRSYHHEWFLWAIIMPMLYFLIFALNILQKLFSIFKCFFQIEFLLSQSADKIWLRFWAIGACMVLLLRSWLLALSVTRRWMRKTMRKARNTLHMHYVCVYAWAKSVLLW